MNFLGQCIIYLADFHLLFIFGVNNKSYTLLLRFIYTFFFDHQRLSSHEILNGCNLTLLHYVKLEEVPQIHIFIALLLGSDFFGKSLLHLILHRRTLVLQTFLDQAFAKLLYRLFAGDLLL